MTGKSTLALTLFLGLSAWVLAFSPSAFGAKAEARDVKSTIASATQALGAANLKTIEFSGSGFDYAIGQNYNGTAPWPKFNYHSISAYGDVQRGQQNFPAENSRPGNAILLRTYFLEHTS